MGYGKVCTVRIIIDAIATGAGSSYHPWTEKRTFHATGVTSAGAGATSIKIEASNDNATWIEIGAISLVLSTTITGDGFASDAPWQYVRGNITSISGTNATVSVYMGVVGY